MKKAVSKPANSNGIMFDATPADKALPKTGDEMDVHGHAGWANTKSSNRQCPSPKQVTRTIKFTVKDYARTMNRLG